MYPDETRIEELRDRFGVHNGQFFADYRFKNLNWYLSSNPSTANTEADEWFCYGDIRDDDVPRLMKLLLPNEALLLGWKELGANQKTDRIFSDGHGLWLFFDAETVIQDIRRDRKRT